MTSYILTSDPNVIQRISDGAFIPNDERNFDWREYQEWLGKGNEPEPASALPPVVQALTADDLATILVKKLILSQSDITKK